MDKLLLRPVELAETLGISRSKAYALLASGEFPTVRVGKAKRIPVDAIRDWIAESLTQAQTQWLSAGVLLRQRNQNRPP